MRGEEAVDLNGDVRTGGGGMSGKFLVGGMSSERHAGGGGFAGHLPPVICST